MNQGNKSIAAWMIVTSLITLGCKRSDELISSTKLEDPTHTLDVVFSEETSKIEYKILGNGAENETVTSVKIIQNKRENVAQWLKEKITANFLPFASLQGNGYYPDYLLGGNQTKRLSLGIWPKCLDSVDLKLIILRYTDGSSSSLQNGITGKLQHLFLGVWHEV